MPRRRRSAPMIGKDMAPRPGTVKWAQRLIDVYLEERDKWALPWWDNVEELYESRQFADIGWNRPDSMGGRLIEPPRVVSIVHSTDAYVFNARPKLFFEARMAETEELAEVLEDAVNAEWRRDFAALQPDHRLIIRDTIKCGLGIALTTIETDFERAARERKRRMKKMKRRLGDPGLANLTRDEIIAEYKRAGYDTEDDDEDESEYLSIEPDDRLGCGRMVTRRVAPRDWLCDVNSTAPKKIDAQWMGRRFYVYADALMASDLYKNKGSLTPAAADGRRHDDGRPVFLVNELFFRTPEGKWDMKCFVDGSTEWNRIERAPYIGGNPYRISSWNETGNRLFPCSDIQPVYGQIQQEINFHTRLYDAYMRECEDFSIADGTVITEKDLAGITNFPVVGAILRIAKLQGRPIDSILQRVKKDPKTPELLNYLAIIEKQIQDGTGMGPNQSMQALKSDTSAGEANILMSMYQARLSAKVYSTQDLFAETALQRAQGHAQFYSPGQMGRLAGPRAEALWATTQFSDRQIRDGLAVTVEEGSMQPQSDAQRAALYDTMLQEAFTSPVAAATYNVVEVQRRRARARGVHDGSALLNPKITSGQIAGVSMDLALQGAGQQGSAPAPRGRSNAEPQQ